MYPVLFKLGQLSIFTYGFFIAVGFFVGIVLARREARRVGEDPEKITDLSFYVLVFAIIGSRFFYIVTNLEIFLADPLEIVKLWKGGLVFYGGFIAALIAALIYMKINNLPVFKTADIFAPAIPAGQFFGRLGCLFAGCCYGKACDLPWAITFKNPDSLAPLGIPLHPTQLYHAGGNLILFGFLWFFRKRKTFEGQLFWLYVLLYGIIRSFTEVFRGDFRGSPVFGILSVSQVLGGTMAIIAIVMLIIFTKRVGTKLL